MAYVSLFRTANDRRSCLGFLIKRSSASGSNLLIASISTGRFWRRYSVSLDSRRPRPAVNAKLYFADEPRSSSTSSWKCNSRSSASRSTALSQSGGGERCARASGFSLACRIDAIETLSAFAKSSWSTRANRQSVAFLKVMYAVLLTLCRVYIILHTLSNKKSFHGVNQTHEKSGNLRSSFD